MSIQVLSFTDITGSLTLPDGELWMWRTFNNLAIGVNGATTGDNPIKWTGSGNAAALGGSPPKAKYIETCNQRVWLVSATAPNTVYWSKLGDPEDWTTTGAAGAGSINIMISDGDTITGLYSHRTRLFVFKRNRVYQIVMPAATGGLGGGLANTDPDNWHVELIANNVGCVSAWSIQSVGNDIVFLSDNGVETLSAVTEYGDFSQKVLSKKVRIDNKSINFNDNVPVSVVNPSRTQYWLSCSSDLTSGTPDLAYVLDFKDDGTPRWVTFTGKVVGTCYAVALSPWSDTAHEKMLFIGGSDGNLYVYYNTLNQYEALPAGVYSDAGTAYRKYIKSKQYPIGNPMTRKILNYWGLGIVAKTNNINLKVTYTYDNLYPFSQNHFFNFDDTGSLWDDSVYDTATYAAPVSYDEEIIRRFGPGNGRRAESIQYEIECNDDDKGYALKWLGVESAPLSRKGVKEVD